jgi:hypothetical protein
MNHVVYYCHLYQNNLHDFKRLLVTDDDQYCQQLKTYHPSHHQSGLNCAQQRQATSQQQQLADGYPSALGSQTNFFGTGQFGHALPYQHQQASTGINVFQGQQPAGAAHTLQHQVVVLEKTKATNIGSSGGNIHLWHFIRELLERPKEYGSCVRWVDRKEGW